MVWQLLLLAQASVLVLTHSAVLSKEPTIVPVSTRDGSKLPSRFLEAVRSPTQNVLLVLKDMRAEVRPEVAWEVYVEPVGTPLRSPGTTLVGIVSFFDLRNDSTEFVFAIDKAIVAAGEKALQIRFVPTSGVVVDGAPQAATVRSPVTIGEIRLGIEAQ